MTLFLSVAWAGVEHELPRARIQGLYEEYQSDFVVKPARGLREVARLLGESVGLRVGE